MIFRTSIKLTLLLAVLALVFARLGFWQLQRKAEKEALFARWENAPVLSVAEAASQQLRFARVRAYGRYDPDRHILVDNRIHKGKAGVHVLTPFTTEDGLTFLVNRGWLPLPADRSSLPEFSTSAAVRSISGRLNRLESEGPRLGTQPPPESGKWPQLLTYIDHDPIENALGSPVLPWVVQLDADQEEGFAGRQWKAATMPPETHGAYALQWFGLMSAAIVIWLVLGFRSATRHNTPTERNRT